LVHFQPRRQPHRRHGDLAISPPANLLARPPYDSPETTKPW